MGKLDGKVAVITEATSGMALASAKLFVEEGAYVFITGRRQENLAAQVRMSLVWRRRPEAHGVNLALYSTPMENQAKEVDGHELQRSQLDQAIFILTVDDPKWPTDSAVVKSIESKNAALLEDERRRCIPRPHEFELIAQ